MIYEEFTIWTMTVTATTTMMTGGSSCLHTWVMYVLYTPQGDEIVGCIGLLNVDTNIIP